MLAGNTTLTAINRRNRDFWDDQRTLLFRRLADEAVREVALEILDDDLRPVLSAMTRLPPLKSKK
jgi:hypothetical protein